MRVLIVDDEQAMLTVMKRMLAKLEVISFPVFSSNAAAALEAADQSSFDMAFIDIKIGEDNGLELARRLRARNAGLDIVFITSHKEFAFDSFDMYPLDYMVKPISRERLLQTVNRALERRESAKQAGAVPERSVRLAVQALGSLDVRGTTDVGAIRWRSKKSAELFAYLVLSRGRQVSKSRMIEDLFPDMAADNARTYLNTAAYQLRQVLAPHGLRNAVNSSQDQLWLDCEQLEIDFIQFEIFVDAVGELSENVVTEALYWEQRYQGDLYEDNSYAWASAERVRLGKLYKSFAKRLVEWLLENRMSEKALAPAVRLVERNALDEACNVLLLRVCSEMGELVGLREHYAQFADLYEQELGIPVPDNLEELYLSLSAGLRGY